MKKIILFSMMAVFFWLNVPLCVFAEETALTKTLEITKNDIAGKAYFLPNFELGGARVNVIRSIDNETVIKVVVTYYESGPEPSLETEISGTGDAYFYADFVSGYDDNLFSWNSSQKMQIWDISIGTFGIDTKLRIAGGGIIAEAIDFGGLPLTYLELMLGGAAVDIDFSVPTTRQLKDIFIQCGGGILELSNIGNTDFENFSLMGGGMISILDFNGTYSGERHDAIITAAGSMNTLIFPDNAGVKAGTLSIASAIFTSGNDWENEVIFPFVSSVYQTEDYNDEAVKLFFDIITVGSVLVLER